jgi:hypothetical protein
MIEQLTQNEIDYYTKFALIDICNFCGDIIPIYNHQDGKNYLTWYNNKLYCCKCKKENELIPT